MIINERKIELTTSDLAPAPGDPVYMHSGVVTKVVRAVAHMAAMEVNPRPRSPSGGLWTIKAVGQRKPEIAVSVIWAHVETAPSPPGEPIASVQVNAWREVAGR
jgi:hypothetical protein